MSMVFVIAYLIQKMNKTPPKMLNDFPYNLNVYFVHGFVPAMFPSVLSILFFAKSKGLRRELKQIISSTLNVSL